MVTILPQRRQGFACLLDRLCPITPDTRLCVTSVGIAESEAAASKTGTSDRAPITESTREPITDDTAFYVTLTGYVALDRAEAGTRRQAEPTPLTDAHRRQDGTDTGLEEMDTRLTARARRASDCSLTAAAAESTNTTFADTLSANTPDAGTSFAKDVPGILTVTPSLQDTLSRSTVSTSDNACPKCGGQLGIVNLYCGGRGYVQFDSCTQCEYQIRTNDQRRCRS